MRIQKRLSAVLLTLLLSCALVLTTTLAYAAHPYVDVNKKGSITFTMKTANGRPVNGAELSIYKVASVTEDDGNYYFELLYNFKEMGNVSLPDFPFIKTDSTFTAELAESMRDYVNGHDIPVTAKVEIESDGTATIDNLEVGLYLVVQSNRVSGYSPISPFLVSIPQYIDETGNEHYEYKVDAYPKMGDVDPNNPPPPTSRPEEPDNPSSNPASEPTSSEPTSSEPTSSQPESSEPTSSEPTSSQPESSQTGSQPAGGSTPGGTTPGGNTPGGNTPGGNTPGGTTPGGNTPGGGTTPGGGSSTPTLPQTGQLNWPIPVLVVAGLSLILVGWGVNYNSKSRKSHEA